MKPVQNRHSKTPGFAPSGLMDGELFVNSADGCLYHKGEDGSVRKVLVRALENVALEDWGTGDIVVDPEGYAVVYTQDGRYYTPGQAVEVAEYGGEGELDAAGYPLVWVRGATVETPGQVVEIGLSTHADAEVDPQGNVLHAFDERGLILAGMRLDALAWRDMVNDLATQGLRTPRLTKLATFSCALNLWLGLGQSIAAGAQAFRGLTKTAYDLNLMMGLDTRPFPLDPVAGQTGYALVGPDEFRPLIPVVRNNDSVSDGVLATDVEVAAFASSAGYAGEGPEATGCNFFKRLWNARRGLQSDPTRVLVAAVPAVGGKSLDQMGPVNVIDSVDRWSRTTGACDQLVTLAAARSAALGVPLSSQMLVAQLTALENEYLLATCTSLTAPDIVSMLGLYNTTLKALSVSKFGQSADEPPLFLLSVPGGGYTRNVDGAGNVGLHVPKAILDFAFANDNVAISGPNTLFAKKDGFHLRANGQRPMGVLNAIRAAEWIIERRRTLPFHARGVYREGRKLYVETFAPAKGIRTMPCYPDGAAVSLAQHGLRVSDVYNTRSLTISGIRLGQTVIEITLAEDPGQVVRAWYADQTYSGQGNICDSQVINPLLLWEYLAASGQDVQEDIVGVRDLPYSVPNPLIPFSTLSDR